MPKIQQESTLRWLAVDGMGIVPTYAQTYSETVLYSFWPSPAEGAGSLFECDPRRRRYLLRRHSRRRRMGSRQPLRRYLPGRRVEPSPC